jgi:phospholipase/carboxylesterase
MRDDRDMLKTVELQPKAPGLSRTLVLLHGFGADEHDLLELGHALDPRLRIVSLQAPVSLGGRQRAWYPLSQDARGNIVSDPLEARNGLEAAVSAIETVARTSPQPFLLGFSQGGGVALAVMLTRPDLIGGVLSFSGVPPTLEPAELAPREKLRGKPVFAGHGTQDPVVSIARGRQLKSIAEQAGLALTFREYEMGHMIVPEELRDAHAWLAERI